MYMLFGRARGDLEFTLKFFFVLTDIGRFN